MGCILMLCSASGTTQNWLEEWKVTAPRSSRQLESRVGLLLRESSAFHLLLRSYGVRYWCLFGWARGELPEDAAGPQQWACVIRFSELVLI